ncbi:PspC domain-containing protein [candidate division KSB1 bacterium]|nr:PspC domain-containing protein [candidate division KSB1 bacterium]
MKKNGAKEKFETDQTSADTTVRAEHDKFVRSRKNRLIGGVCGGLADYIHVDVTFVRIIWVIFTLFSHIIWGLLLYIVLLIVIPEELLVNSTESKSATAPKSVPVPKSDADSPKANTKAKPAPKSAPRKKSKDSDSEEAES